MIAQSVKDERREESKQRNYFSTKTIQVLFLSISLILSIESSICRSSRVYTSQLEAIKEATKKNAISFLTSVYLTTREGDLEEDAMKIIKSRFPFF